MHGTSHNFDVLIRNQPVGPTLNNKTPNLTTVCDGQSVSATFNSGSGGVLCSDVFQYRFDGAGMVKLHWRNASQYGGTYFSQDPGTEIRMYDRCRRSATSWVTLATWNVNPQPVGPTLNVKTPNLSAVCDQQSVSAIFSAGSGGVGCTDAYQYRFDGAGGWSGYTGGTPLNTAGHCFVEIAGRRSGCTAGAGCTGTTWVTLATWNVNPQPVGDLNVKSQTFRQYVMGSQYQQFLLQEVEEWGVLMDINTVLMVLEDGQVTQEEHLSIQQDIL